ncbi:MAG TPA: hypothetical protein VF288_12325 [Mycobacteriales bacterium]
MPWPLLVVPSALGTVGGAVLGMVVGLLLVAVWSAGSAVRRRL